MELFSEVKGGYLIFNIVFVIMAAIILIAVIIAQFT